MVETSVTLGRVSESGCFLFAAIISFNNALDTRLLSNGCFSASGPKCSTKNNQASATSLPSSSICLNVSTFLYNSRTVEGCAWVWVGKVEGCKVSWKSDSSALLDGLFPRATCFPFRGRLGMPLASPLPVDCTGSLPGFPSVVDWGARLLSEMNVARCCHRINFCVPNCPSVRRHDRQICGLFIPRSFELLFQEEP